MRTQTPCGRGGDRRAFALLFASSLLACGVLPRACGKEPAPRAVPAPKEAAVVPAETLPLDPFQRRAALDAAYRLQPDRRFLLAAEAVQRFFVAGASGHAIAVREGEGWRIRLGSADVGALTDLPDFQQALSMLDGFAKRVAGEHPVPGGTTAPDASPAPFDWEPDAIAALRGAQAQWLSGQQSPELARRACRALASLAFQDLDTLGVGDRLPAQALAMLAVTHALGVETAREEALTAAALGYTTAARAAAMRLPEGDALRLYLEDSPTLEASARGASMAARYLQLRRLHWADDEEGEARWLESELRGEQRRLPVLALRLRSRHGWRSPVAEEMPLDVLFAAAEQSGDSRLAAKRVEDPPLAAAALGFREGQLLVTASELIGRVDSAATGPFYDAGILQSYDRAMLYSALAQWSTTLLDGLRSSEATKELSRLLGDDRAPEARDFQRWLLLRVAARLPDPAAAGTAAKTAPEQGLSGILEKLLFDGQQGNPRASLRQQLLQGLSDLPNLGPQAPLLLFEELNSRLDWADPAALKATRSLAAKLDTRVDHRVRFANLVWDTLHDLALEERLMRSVFRDARASHPGSSLWFARQDGDADLLQDLARSAAAPFPLRVDAVAALGKMGKLTPAQLEDQLEQLETLHPFSRKPTDALVDAFRERKDYDNAVRAVRRWLTKNESRPDLDVAIMHAKLGQDLYRQGRLEEAWQAVEPYLQSWQGGVMHTAADVAAARGHEDEARRILAKYVERYPDGTGAARSWWLLRDYDAAAKFLAHLPRPPSSKEWVWTIGKDFAEVLGPLPVEESRRATAAMQRAGIGAPALIGIADALANAGFPEHAFEIVSPLANPAPGPRAAAPLTLRAYLYLKQWKGQRPALEWIRSGSFVNAGPSLALLVYDHRAYELLWDLLPEPQPGPLADNFWLQRTASLLLDPKLATGERRNASREHYQAAGHSHYHELGKFLLGQLDEHQAAKLVTDAEKACEVSYYLGLKSETEGHLQDATAWYRNAVESANPRWAEYLWSYEALQRFQSSGKTLARLKADRAAAKD